MHNIISQIMKEINDVQVAEIFYRPILEIYGACSSIFILSILYTVIIVAFVNTAYFQIL